MPEEPEEEPEVEPEPPVDPVTFGKDLIYAVRVGDLDEVTRLLDLGVPIGFTDGPMAWTALKWAASEGFEDVLALLLERGAAEAEMEAAQLAAIAAEETGAGSSGSPLHWAAYKGHVRLVWRLLIAKPKFSAKEVDGEGNTPLHLAAAGGHLPVLQAMLAQGVDVNLLNAYGNTPLLCSTDPKCRALLKEATAASKEGRAYLCACSGVFCSEGSSVANVVIDATSAPNQRPVRYSSDCAGKILTAEDALSMAVKAADVPKLEDAIRAAVDIGASQPIIDDATAALERLKAQIALSEAVAELEAVRPLQDRALLRPMQPPLQRCRETGVAIGHIEEGEQLVSMAEAEVALFDLMNVSVTLKMVDPEEYEEGAPTEPPAADSDLAKKGERTMAQLGAAIQTAIEVSAMAATIEQAEAELAILTAESDLRKALLPPKEGVTEEGSPTWTQHNGSLSHSKLEDLMFRNDFLDASLEKCEAGGTAPGILIHVQKVQKDLKADLKVAEAEEAERIAKEEAAAAKAAKKKKGK